MKIVMDEDRAARFKEGMALLGHEVEWGLVLEGLKYACAVEEDGAKEPMPKPQDDATPTPTPKRKFFRRSAKADFVGWRWNYPKKSIEVAFEKKPEQDVLAHLRASIFWWAPNKGVWYNTTPSRRTPSEWEAWFKTLGIPKAKDIIEE